MSDVVVVGAGVMGLLTAHELALAGFRVTMLERGGVGMESSWAGGGIVSPLYPWRYPAPVTALATRAQQAYPRLARLLLERTGVDPELESCGLLMLDAPDAAEAYEWAVANDRLMESWGREDMQRRVPGLAHHWQAGLWMPAIANIRNPRLLKALRLLVEQEGVVLHEQAEVTGWKRQGGRLQAVVLRDGRHFSAEAFVVCGGAWSPALLQEAGVAAPLPVRPVRGQMLLYRRPPGELPCMILAEGRYVIPRRDGHVLCGSTLEEVGFDKGTTAAALASLSASAARLWPVLAGEQPVGHWAGLRPGSPSGIPFIGKAAGCDNLWVNAGHFRNGLVLAPASAQLLADLMAGRPAQLDPGPYAPGSSA